MADVNVSNRWDRWKIGDIEFDTFISADVKLEGQVVTEPVERGSFAAYNKQFSPIEMTVTLARSGDADELQSMIDALVGLRMGTELFSVVTPEYEYENMTLESFSYTRQREDGLNILIVEARCIEVREVEPQTTNVTIKPISKSGAKNPEDASTKDSGKKSTEEKGKYNSLLSRLR